MPTKIENQTLLDALADFNREFNDPKSDKRSLFKKVLNNVLAITKSEYGFIGEIFQRDGNPVLKTFAITDISWDEETAALYKKYEAKGMEFTNLDTLFGYTMKTAKVVISNDPMNDNRRGGLPKGHPALNYYLGIPILDSKNVMVGMMGIANKPGGYSEKDLAFLKPMISMTSAFISLLKANEAKDFFSGSLDLYKKAIDSHAIVSVADVKGNITFVNEKFCELTKYSPAELIGQNHRIINSGFHDASFFKDLWKTIASGKTWSGQIRNRAKDDSIYWVDATIVPFLDEKKKPIQYVAIRTDITKLKEQERELDNFFRLSVDLLCIADLEGNFIKISESFPKALGFTKAEILRTNFMDLIHPDDKESTIKEMEKLALGQVVMNFENRYRRKDGSYILISWKSTVNTEDGLIYATATDITNKREIEEREIKSKIEMEKARAKDTFLANMSHEIRTPLNAIIGFNDLLKGTNLDHEQRGHVEIIGSALKNLNVIINDILDFSKLESGKLDLEKRPFSIEALIKRVVDMHIDRAKSKNIKLLLSYDTDTPRFVVGDETRLSQILINLLSNAVKFTSKGKIEVKVVAVINEENANIQFSVQDTGIGIDSSKLNMVFERFTQAEDYTTRMYGGTGLGLNIVKSLVELQGGELKVKSKLGEGSEFSFEIVYPISDEGPAELELEHNQGQSLKPLDNLKILLVEDNEHNQILAKAYLERNGAIVEIEGNGSLGVKAIEHNKYDLVLMDIQMPVMDGLEATKIIRNKLKNKIPIIGCSAHALESEKNRCKNSGMDDYITKPYSEFDLIHACSKYATTTSVRNDILSDEQVNLEDDNIELALINLEKKLGRETMEILKNMLIARIPSDLKKINLFFKSDDLRNLEGLAHNLKGSLVALDLNQGANFTTKLEYAIKEKRIEQLDALIADLTAYLERLLAEIRIV